MKRGDAPVAQVRRVTRAQAVYTKLKERLEPGRDVGNGKWPTLNELCREYHVSINTARKAVGMLVREGCLVTKPGAGIQVRRAADTEAGRHSDIISVMCHLDEASLYALQQHALDAGVMLCAVPQQTEHYNPQVERRILEQVLKSRHRGLLANCTPNQPDNLDLIDRLTAEGVRVLHINHYAPEVPSQSHILPDYRKAGYMAAMHLMMAGYERLAYVTNDPEWPSGAVFRRGFLEALHDFGRWTGAEADHVFGREGGFLQYGKPTIDEFQEFLMRDERYLGLAVLSPGLATLVLEQVRECGRYMPQQVGLVSTTYLDHDAAPGIDCLSFDHTGRLKAAIDAIMAPAWQAPKMLMAPVLQKNGSVREYERR